MIKMYFANQMADLQCSTVHGLSAVVHWNMEIQCCENLVPNETAR